MEKKKYKIIIEETLTREVTVEAATASDAVDIVRKQWKNGEHELSGDDFCDVEFLVEDHETPLNFN